MRRIGSSVSSSWRKALTPTTMRRPWSISVCSAKLASAISRCGKLCLTASTIPPSSSIRREVGVGLLLHAVGQRLDEVGAAQRVDRVRHAGLVGDDLLRAQRDPHRLLGGQRERLVVGVGVQRLRAAQHAGQRLDRRARDVVQRLLGGQRHARRLHVGAHAATSAGRAPPKVSRSSRAQIRRAARSLAISSKKSICALKKNDSARREVVDVQAAADGLLDVGQPVLERERELLRRRRAGLADVVAADAHRVPARHVARAPLDHVAQQAHRRVDREAPLLLGDVLLEDVGLDRAAQVLGGDPVRLGGDDVEGEHDRRRRVDRHGDRHVADVDARRTASACRRACRPPRPRARPRRATARGRSRGP